MSASRRPWAAIVWASVTLACGCRGDAVHADRPSESITHFTERTELFVEFPALVQGEESSFAVHLTRLVDFKPVTTGGVTVILSGGDGAEERFDAAAPQVPGIFRPVARPREAGERRLAIVVDADGPSDRHELGTVTVYSSAAASADAAPHEAAAPSDGITFLKEQQWPIAFATAPVEERTLRASLFAYGVLKARRAGEARVTAPLAGRLVSSADELPSPGAAVEKDEVLAVIAPRLGGEPDPASLEIAVARARRDLELARTERARLEALGGQDAVPARRVLAARHDEKDAEADLTEAEHRLAQYRGVHRAPGAEPKGQISVRAPVAGILAEILVASGQFLEEGEEMFHLVDLDRLWLEARIPEADLGRVQEVTGAWFEVDGMPTPFEIGGKDGGRVVTVGAVVDGQSRTVPLLFEVENPGHRLRAGMFARVHVATGGAVTGPAVPASAITEDQGRSVAYVQVGGEAFEQRTLTLGVRDGDLVQVLEGLRSGERVVTRGAYSVRLAAASGSVPAHGHAH